jgi:hypothetical protein
MSRTYVDHKGLLVPDVVFGVCAWQLPDGTLIKDSDDNLMCAEGNVGDPRVERLVAEAANYWSDGAGGKVHWINGARKVSSDERDDQTQRLIDGETPDPYEDILDPTKKMGGA